MKRLKLTMQMRNNQAGLTLIEMMVSLTVASILSIGVVSAFSAQSSIYIKQAQRMQSNDDGRQAFDVLSRLMQHAQAGSIVITDNVSDILVRFTIPQGFPIWPNTGGTFTDNVIFIKWADNNTGDNVPNQIRIANSNDTTTPANSAFVALSGLDQGINTRITKFNVALLGDNLNYKMTLVARTGSLANGNDTYFDGFILPRN